MKRKIQVSTLIEEIKAKDPRLHQILKSILLGVPSNATEVIEVDGQQSVQDAIDDIRRRAIFRGDPAGGDLDGTYPDPTISQEFINKLLSIIFNTTPRLLYVLTTTVTVNTASRTSLLAPAGYTLKPGFFNKIGKTIRIKASGYMSTGNPAPTLQIGLDVDASPILDTGIRQIHTDIINKFWEYEAVLTYRGGNQLVGQAAFHYASR